jgi:hypothetical protein
VSPVVPFLKKGDRVRVIAEKAPTCRTGTVMGVVEGQGYSVHHDKPAWTEGLFAREDTFNWTFDEVEPLIEETKP